MGRYAGYTTTRRDAALRILRRVLRRPGTAQAVNDPAPERTGPDYTTWRVRAVVAIPALGRRGDLVAVGEQGVVTGREWRGRRWVYTVRFVRTDLVGGLPDPEHVQLLDPRAS